MKLLVLAQTPPPLHGQSVMVQRDLEGLRATPGIEIHHINLRLSRDHADIGRWRFGKLARTLASILRALALQVRYRCHALYYVPAPPDKRGALYRDWLVLALCRPFFRHLVLHWHAAGLADWLASGAHPCERTLTRILLGRPALSIVLADLLRSDADYFRSRRVAVVPNGVPDPGPPPPASSDCWQVLFLGLCSEGKGVFAAAAAVVAANRRAASPLFRLVAAGPFPDAGTAARFEGIACSHPAEVRHAGIVHGAARDALFAASHVLILPTRYAAEGMPLVVLEALAHDLPVLATRWRALPELVPPACGRLVASSDTDALAEALLDLQANPPGAGTCRSHYLAHYSMERHLTSLRAALDSLVAPHTS